MSENHCPNVALGRRQNAWGVPEDVEGRIAFPTSAQGFRLTVDTACNQETPLTDSREKADTLDTLNVYQGIASPAQVSSGMYISIKDLMEPLAGDTIMQALQGGLGEMFTAELTAPLAEDDDTMTIGALDKARIPQRGVIELETDSGDKELIGYVMRTPGTVVGTWTLSGLKRGYKGTMPLSGSTGDIVMLKSRWYMQNVCRQEFSFWVQIDAILQCMQGARITQAGIAIATGDAVELTFQLSGRRLYSAGPSDLAVAASSGATSLIVADARAFFAGQKLRNATKKDDNTGTGYAVTSVDEKTNTLTIAPGISAAWAQDDVITWWMPTIPVHGQTIENRETTMTINGVRGKMRPGSISFNTPVTFTEEVGDRFPGQGIDGTRTSTVDYNVLMRKDAALRLRDGFEGKEVRFDAEFGMTDGQRIIVVVSRLKLTTATAAFENPTVTLNTSGRILGIHGEDSVEIILE